MKKLKSYYIWYHKNIHNEYILCWAEQGSRDERRAIAKGFEKINRQRAFNLCVESRHKLKSPFYEGFHSSDKILPFYALVSKHRDSMQFATMNGYVYEEVKVEGI